MAYYYLYGASVNSLRAKMACETCRDSKCSYKGDARNHRNGSARVIAHCRYERDERVSGALREQVGIRAEIVCGNVQSAASLLSKFC